MRKFYRAVIEFIFPSIKAKRLHNAAIGAHFSKKFEEYVEHIKTRTPKDWNRMNDTQRALLTSIIKEVSDDDFGWYRFEIPSHNPQTAPVCDVLKALNGVYDGFDKEYQQDAYEWLYNNIPDFAERSDKLC